MLARLLFDFASYPICLSTRRTMSVDNRLRRSHYVFNRTDNTCGVTTVELS